MMEIITFFGSAIVFVLYSRECIITKRIKDATTKIIGKRKVTANDVYHGINEMTIFEYNDYYQMFYRNHNHCNYYNDDSICAFDMTNCVDTAYVVFTKICSMFSRKWLTYNLKKNVHSSDLFLDRNSTLNAITNLTGNGVYLVQINICHLDLEVISHIHFFVILKLGDSYYKIQSYKDKYSILDKDQSVKMLTKREIINELTQLLSIMNKTEYDNEFIDIWELVTGIKIVNCGNDTKKSPYYLTSQFLSLD